MPVVKEYLCFGHGPFESSDDTPVCPKGCTMVERRFYTAPGLRSDKTAHLDATLDTIASDFKLSDMNNDHGHGAARVVDARTRKAMEQQAAMQKHLANKFPGMKVQNTRSGTGGWGGVAPGGVYETGGNIRDAQRGGGAEATLKQVGAPATNAVQELKPELPKHRVVAKRDPGGAESIARVRAA